MPVFQSSVEKNSYKIFPLNNQILEAFEILNAKNITWYFGIYLLLQCPISTLSILCYQNNRLKSHRRINWQKNLNEQFVPLKKEQNFFWPKKQRFFWGSFLLNLGVMALLWRNCPQAT